jgi:hypothetical protein
VCAPARSGPTCTQPDTRPSIACVRPPELAHPTANLAAVPCPWATGIDASENEDEPDTAQPANSSATATDAQTLPQPLTRFSSDTNSSVVGLLENVHSARDDETDRHQRDE